MKVLIAHNRYRSPGGEDEVFHRESALLRSAGHDVLDYVRHNDEIANHRLTTSFRTGMKALWNRESAKELRSLLQEERPQVVHFHNTFPLISPAAYYACKEEGIPVVQSLHNPRLICPAATLYREGRQCQQCLGRPVAWPAIVHACYHGSRPQTAVVTGMLALHRWLGTWQEQVDAYIVFTNFYRQKFIAAGFPAEKIFLKPHFLADPGTKPMPRGYALFLGRLAPEKGIITLLRAWRKLKHIPLRITGSGPLEREVHRFTQDQPSVTMSPYLSRAESMDLIRGARFLVWPSEGNYETFGLVAIEAFACGTPVIASRSGAMQEVVEDAKTGLHFEPGNVEDLAAKVEWAWSHPQEMEVMGRTGRAEYLRKYTAPRNYKILSRIYRRVIEQQALKPGRVQVVDNPVPGHCA